MRLDEAHNIGKVLQGQPDRDEMIKLLATKVRADTPFAPIDKISWSELKNRRDQIVVVKGDQGSAVIYWDGHNYEVYVAGDVRPDSFDNGSAVLAKVKPVVGKVRGLFLSSDVSTTGIRSKRRASKIDSSAGQTRDRLAATLANYAPKYLKSAIANLGGMAQQMIKVENYGGARQKLERMAALKQLMVAMDRPSGTAMPGAMTTFMKNALDRAILYTYAYEHPGMTQERRSYRGTEIHPVNQGQYNDWMTQTLQRRDATFATILSFLKQEFLTGKLEG